MSEESKPVPADQEIPIEDLEQVSGGFSWGATQTVGAGVVQKVVGGISPGATKKGDGSV